MRPSGQKAHSIPNRLRKQSSFLNAAKLLFYKKRQSAIVNQNLFQKIYETFLDRGQGVRQGWNNQKDGDLSS